MKLVVRMMKGLLTTTLIVGLCFASAVFTVILYANFTGQDHLLTKEAYADALKASGGILASGFEIEHHARVDLMRDPYEAWVPAAQLPDAPLVMQYPELPRGCEVTSLTMMLQYAGIEVDKLTLADQLPRDSTPIQYDAHGISYWGHPNRGFVGDITLDSPGFGIYHDPLIALSAEYIPESIDLTGESFKRLELQISKGIPVVAWTTVGYDEPRQWVEWDTPDGLIRTTHEEHAVLLTGYDEEFVYFNDPLKNNKNIQINKEQFIHSWEVMGKQAISYEQEDP